MKFDYLQLCHAYTCPQLSVFINSHNNIMRHKSLVQRILLTAPRLYSD